MSFKFFRKICFETPLPLFFSFFLIGLFGVSQVHAQGQQVGTLVSFSGGVKVLRADGLTRENATKSMALYEGDRIETEGNGNGKIEFIDQSQLAIGQSTTLKITKYLFNPQTKTRGSLLHLIIGQVRVQVKPYIQWGVGQYQIQTGSAVAGVRGTDFLVRVLTNGVSEFYLMSGSLELRGTEGGRRSISLASDQYSRVPLGGDPAVPMRYDARELSNLLKDMKEKVPPEVTQLEKSQPGPKKSPGAGKPINQSEWAKMLSEKLGLASGAVQEGLDSSSYIALLVGEESKVIEAEDGSNQHKYLSKEEGDRKDISGGGFLEAKNLSGTLRISYFVSRTGKYPLRVKSKGTLLISLGNQTLVVESPPDQKEMEWKSVGQFQFQTGENLLTIVVSRGSAIDALQVDSRCSDPIMPTGGWKPDNRLRFKDKAETMVQAMDQEGNLPVDPSFIQVIRAANFKAAKGDYKVIEIDRRKQNKRLNPKAVQAGAQAADLNFRINVPTDGIFTFSVQTAGSAKFSYSVDGCSIGRELPQFSEPNPVWQEINSRTLKQGVHVLEVTVPAGGLIEALRVIKRKGTPQDHLNLLKSLGFKEGGMEDVVTVQDAMDNLNNDLFRPPEKPEEEILAMPEETTDTPVVFLPDQEFPFSSPASPTLPGF